MPTPPLDICRLNISPPKTQCSPSQVNEHELFTSVLRSNSKLKSDTFLPFTFVRTGTLALKNVLKIKISVNFGGAGVDGGEVGGEDGGEVGVDVGSTRLTEKKPKLN